MVALLDTKTALSGQRAGRSIRRSHELRPREVPFPPVARVYYDAATVVWASIPFVIAVIAGGQAAPLPVITDISAIRALSQAEAARGYPVRIRGVITHFDELKSTRLFIFDGRSGQFIQAAPNGSLVAWGPIRSGDTIEVTGHTIRGGYAPNVEPTEIRNLGALARPAPLHSSTARC